MKKFIFVTCLLAGCSMPMIKGTPYTPEAFSGCTPEAAEAAYQRIAGSIAACFSDYGYKKMFFMDGGSESFKAKQQKNEKNYTVSGNYSGEYKEVFTTQIPAVSQTDPKTGKTKVIAPAYNDETVNNITFDDTIFDLTLTPLPHTTHSCKTQYQLVFNKPLMKEQVTKVKSFILAPETFKTMASCS